MLTSNRRPAILGVKFANAQSLLPKEQILKERDHWVKSQRALISSKLSEAMITTFVPMYSSVSGVYGVLKLSFLGAITHRRDIGSQCQA